MNIKIKKKEKKFFQLKSVTFTMFSLSLATIVIVLMTGFLIVGIIAPRIYCNTAMKEIESTLKTTIEYYDIDLKDINLNPLIEIDDNSYYVHGESNGIKNPFYHSDEINNLLLILDNDKIIKSANVLNMLSFIAMSRGASIQIVDASGELIYETPKWFSENTSVVRTYDDKSGAINKNPFIYDFIEDNAWILRSSTLSLDETYTLNVKFDLRSFNQNIMIVNRLFIYMAAVAGLFAVLFSIILSFIVTKPLKELKKIAVQMEKMDFTMRYDKNRDDEIGQLGKTLNHMMDRLGTTINKLQAELNKEKRTDKLRREFVAQVSHELKTPVAVVSNYTEALLDGVADTKEEQESYLSTIENECHKMTHIINDLLDLSQMEAKTFKINKSKFMFKDLLEDIIVRYGSLSKGKIEVIKDIKIGNTLMYGDELRIEQAISNLLSNAIKHTKEGGYIKLSAQKEDRMIHVQVENQGEPIDKELLPHIWEAFSKGIDEKGTGLGLSITKHIVEIHKGEYYVHVLDGSVVFGIRLPL